MILGVFRYSCIVFLFSCLSLHAGQIIEVKLADLPQKVLELQGANTQSPYATLTICSNETTVSLGASSLAIGPFNTTTFLAAMSIYPLYVCNKLMPARVAVLDENVEPDIMKMVRTVDGILVKCAFLCVCVDSVDQDTMGIINERLVYFGQHCPLPIIVIKD